jgi:pilus assembly protein FimV
VGRSIAIALFAAALSLAGSSVGHAAGLGKLSVLSSLGEPLRAEIEIVALQPGETEGLTARLASPDAFRAQGIEYSPALSGMKFAIERRGGRALLKLSTSQPVNEPFLEMLVELQWGAGRLVREYTFLLDPPQYKGPQAVAAAPVAKPAAPAAAEPKAEEPKPEEKAEEKPAEDSNLVREPEGTPSEPKEEAQSSSQPIESKPLEPAPSEKEAAAPAAPAASAAEGTQYQVKKGDTLGAIARQHMVPGATLEQMLIAIYRANPDAFIRENVNLVRAGRILNIPGEVGEVDPADAKRLVRAHNADFNAYRSRLAAVPATAEGTPAGRESAGKIEKPEAAPADKQDQLRLSKSEPGKAGTPGGRAAQEDDRVARERALREAQSRQAELEKNVADLQKLLEMKNQQLADLEKKAAKPSAVAPAPAGKAPEKPAAEPAKPAPAAKAPEAPKPAAEAPAAAAPAPAAKPAPEAPKPAAEAPKPAAPAPAAKPAAPKPPAEAPKPAAKKATPASEPSVIDEFLDNPVALGALGGVILLLVGYGAWAWRRKKRSQAKFQDSVLDAAAGAGAASVFGSPSGAPSSASGSTASVSQAPAGMEAEEVDPIAEADVYMAYGRDAQAEEILKEALAKDPNRTTVHAKLLEIYANRKDAKSFEQSALKLKSLTNGSGPEWDKAAALGRSIDPQNGLYGGAGAAAPAAAVAAAPAAAAAPTLDFDIGGAPAAGSSPDITLDATQKEAAPSVDFDLGAAAAGGGAPQSDFTPEGTLIMGKETDQTGGLDFDLGLGGDNKPEPPPTPIATAPADTSGGLDFDLNLDTGDKGADAGTQPAPAMDLSAISLDLGSGDASAPGAGSGDPKWQEVATKLDLAKAYEEMGDKDGARELLNEVMKDGDAAQKGQAQQLLAKLG